MPGRPIGTLKSHCKKTHPLSGDNLYVFKNRKGQKRVCKTCHKARAVAYQRGRRERERRRGYIYMNHAARREARDYRLSSTFQAPGL